MLNIALPKGRLADKAYELLEQTGYPCDSFRDPKRKLVLENPDAGVRYFLVKPSDVAIYAERGVADIGVVGRDIIEEDSPDIYELMDLRFGICRVAVCAKKDYVDNRNGILRVASKFPEIAKRYYAGISREIELIKLNGSVELAPILGLSDVIVDIVESGRTLKENDLHVVSEIMQVSARFISNKTSYKFKYEEIMELTGKLAPLVKENG